jgi:hypothetical protein
MRSLSFTQNREGVLSVSSVVTKKSLGEFLLLKLSLEQYHKVQWYVSVDEYSYHTLQGFENIIVLKNIESDNGSHAANDPEKNRIHLKMMMTKFDALRAAIREHGYGLFIDADIFFTGPIEERVLQLMLNSSIDALLSPHMTNNPTLEGNVGYYNGGFFTLRNTNLLEEIISVSWRHQELGLYYEQQPLQFVSYPYLTVNLPIHYNIGWWRFNEPNTGSRLELLTTNGQQLMFGNRPAICFHAHTLKRLDYENYGHFLVDRVFTQMKATPQNKKYQDILEFITNYAPHDT